MQTVNSKKGRRAAVIIAVFFALGSIVATVAAVTNNKLIKSADNAFMPTEIAIAVQENVEGGSSDESTFAKNTSSILTAGNLEWEKSSNDDTYTAKKEVWVLNVDSEDENNTDAYIRVCILPRWTADSIVVSEDNAKDVLEEKTYSLSFDALTTNSEFPAAINGAAYTIGDVTFTLDGDWASNWEYRGGYFYCKTAIAPGDTTPILLKSVSVSQKTLEQYEGLNLQVDILADAIQTESDAAKERWGYEPGGTAESEETKGDAG